MMSMMRTILAWKDLDAIERTVLLGAMNGEYSDCGTSGDVTIFGIDFEIEIQHESMRDEDYQCLVCGNMIDDLAKGCRSIKYKDRAFHQLCVTVLGMTEPLPQPAWDGEYEVVDGKLIQSGNTQPSGGGTPITVDLSDAKIVVTARKTRWVK